MGKNDLSNSTVSAKHIDAAKKAGKALKSRRSIDRAILQENYEALAPPELPSTAPKMEYIHDWADASIAQEEMEIRNANSSDGQEVETVEKSNKFEVAVDRLGAGFQNRSPPEPSDQERIKDLLNQIYAADQQIHGLLTEKAEWDFERAKLTGEITHLRNTLDKEVTQQTEKNKCEIRSLEHTNKNLLEKIISLENENEGLRSSYLGPTQSQTSAGLYPPVDLRDGLDDIELPGESSSMRMRECRVQLVKGKVKSDPRVIMIPEPYVESFLSVRTPVALRRVIKETGFSNDTLAKLQKLSQVSLLFKSVGN